ncbi:unnamed protein product [Psylliodes chrysocephalus]|uniref:Uncharacterized protein n=1 Tax=Psylliodes chrysocephalus TaxID=3402493 RepID=A0A9P0GE93_9CUCU|nr:unnamed protein product [Psylliodes chrysocephala]
MKIVGLNNKVSDLEENQELKKHVKLLELNQKKNNLLIFGIDKPIKERSIAYVCAEIGQRLGNNLIKSDINDLYSLGKLSNIPLKVEIVAYHKKLLILKNCTKLKNTSWRQEKNSRRTASNSVLQSPTVENKYQVEVNIPAEHIKVINTAPSVPVENNKKIKILPEQVNTNSRDS